LLRQKNKLMRQGHIGKANAIAIRIGKAVINHNANQFVGLNDDNGQQIMWRKVRELTGKKRGTATIHTDLTCLNKHYAAVSTDLYYIQPLVKTTCSKINTFISDWDVFYALDHLKPTATGLDDIPFWFLKTASHLLAEPLSILMNKSITEFTVPTQWKTACITPVPKIQQPLHSSDYRPISITPILSRVTEKLIIREAFNPLLLTSELKADLSDQYAFRPTGSTTAALANILNDLTELSGSNPYVHIISLDFSKAFDTVRHSTLTTKLANLPLLDNIYNWIVDYLTNRSHCTKANGVISDPLPINASIIQGSALGPVSYIINASDLKATVPGNRLHKYADDTYLIVPACNGHTVTTELLAIEQWANKNNLKLNLAKSCEMIVTTKR